MIRKSVLVLLSLSAFVVLTACGKAPLGKAGLQGENVVSMVRDLSGAYARKDIESFMDKVATGYPDREAYRGSVERIFSAYQTIRFKVHYTKMIITVQEKGNIKAAFTWEGEWQTAGGKTTKDGARVTLVFDPGSYKLLAIEGKDPYLPAENPVPARQ